MHEANLSAVPPGKLKSATAEKQDEPDRIREPVASALMFVGHPGKLTWAKSPPSTVLCGRMVDQVSDEVKRLSRRKLFPVHLSCQGLGNQLSPIWLGVHLLVQVSAALKVETTIMPRVSSASSDEPLRYFYTTQR